MKTNVLHLSLISLLGFVVGPQSAIQACGLPPQWLETLAQQAVSPDATAALSAVSQLRCKGPAGFEALWKANAPITQEHILHPTINETQDQTARWKRVKAALDSVGGQCDCYSSGLYWYTDFDAAKAAAKASAKPMLSLRLLGKLDEEYSCANSRFFRATLYPNAAVSKYLSEHFILHWQSVRPVPRITIDFGDGRSIERTITGNSVHYVLDSEGGIVDALPGLFGPKAFLELLRQAELTALECAGITPAEKQLRLIKYHRQSREATQRAWNADLARLAEPQRPLPAAHASLVVDKAPPAKSAGRLAISKIAVEAPLLKSVQPSTDRPSSPGRAEISDEMWARIAELHQEEARLDEVSFKLMVSKQSAALRSSRIATSKQLVENPALRTLRNLQRSIAEDTVRNEYLLHAQVDSWFVENKIPSDLGALNAKIYDELFLMPESDPWLGLAPADIFTGLPNEGLVQALR